MMTRNAVVTTRVTRTHPPGDAHLRVKAPPAPPRPINTLQMRHTSFTNNDDAALAYIQC